MEKKETSQLVCLDASKAWQGTDVPTKIFNENTDIFTDFRARSLVVTDLRSETKGSRLESGG